jgi:nicotinamide mononucleotide transporter
MSPLEITAFLLGVVNVTLVVRRSMWNYPFGLVMVSLYAWIFWDAKLYSDVLLQFFFVVAQLYGWLNWSRNAATEGEVKVERLSPRARLAWLAGSLVVIGLWGWGMHSFTDANYPWWDASIAILSVTAQTLQSRRQVESWFVWIAVDCLAIGLYAAKDLDLTAILYGIFLVLSVWGLLDWQIAERGLEKA